MELIGFLCWRLQGAGEVTDYHFATIAPGRPALSIDKLIKEADDRMYEEKRRQKLALA